MRTHHLLNCTHLLTPSLGDVVRSPARASSPGWDLLSDVTILFFPTFCSNMGLEEASNMYVTPWCGLLFCQPVQTPHLMLLCWELWKQIAQCDSDPLSSRGALWRDMSRIWGPVIIQEAILRLDTVVPGSLFPLYRKVILPSWPLTLALALWYRIPEFLWQERIQVRVPFLGQEQKERLRAGSDIKTDNGELALALWSWSTRKVEEHLPTLCVPGEVHPSPCDLEITHQMPLS